VSMYYKLLFVTLFHTVQQEKSRCLATHVNLSDLYIY